MWYSSMYDFCEFLVINTVNSETVYTETEQSATWQTEEHETLWLLKYSLHIYLFSFLYHKLQKAS